MSKDKDSAVASDAPNVEEAVASAATLEPVGVDGEPPVSEEPIDDNDKYRQELEKAKKYIMKMDRANKDLKQEINEYRTQTPDNHVVQADSDFVIQTMEEMFDRKFRQFQSVQDKQIYEGALQKLSRHVAERDAIDWHYKNSIKLTGDLKVDLKNAWNLANAHKIERAAQKRVDDAHHRSARKDNATALAGGQSAVSNRGSSSGQQQVYSQQEQAFADFVANEKKRMEDIAKAKRGPVAN